MSICPRSTRTLIELEPCPALFYRHPGRGRTDVSRRPIDLAIFYNLRMKRVVHAACPHDCPDACGGLITIEDGRATRFHGSPGLPVTRGSLRARLTTCL